MGGSVKEVHIWVSGRVQGVGFRAWAKWLAEQHELNGFVRNLEDGRVEICAQGEALEEFLRMVRERPGVDRVDQEIRESREIYSSFKILR